MAYFYADIFPGIHVYRQAFPLVEGSYPLNMLYALLRFLCSSIGNETLRFLTNDHTPGVSFSSGLILLRCFYTLRYLYETAL